MTQKPYNVWGRMVRDVDVANARALLALSDNPKIKDLHIERIIVKEPYRTLTYYRVQWYDHSVAMKCARDKKAWTLYLASLPKHVCNCTHCDL